MNIMLGDALSVLMMVKDDNLSALLVAKGDDP
jgi:hypothetical protein